MKFHSSSGYSGIELTKFAMVIITIFVLFDLFGIGFFLHLLWLILINHLRWV